MQGCRETDEKKVEKLPVEIEIEICSWNGARKKIQINFSKCGFVIGLPQSENIFKLGKIGKRFTNFENFFFCPIQFLENMSEFMLDFRGIK